MGRMLVTGGAGFIGSHLVDALLSRGDQVRVLDGADCVVIATDHSAYDWAAIHRDARLIVDTRRTAPRSTQL